ncbi:hypothetical protein N825_23985 [Skermanella stibiiresistens SB22]|uniref:HTH marR-type domain-containing protein n=1 Tax=Skermanella stibiiresistens SB22 TaxID=1385369 RepID=W9HAR8_9PROT|nr:ROK family transcriptional regulator [Skermanella stibiiresistens]EWY41836.1 hypothetical protein N825_23985 [Skermanella stibiiresistens SB22]
MIVTPSRLKRINTSRVLSEIHNSPGISRRELSRRLNSTDASLSRLTRDLITRGLVMERDASTRPMGRGRPNVGLFLNPTGLHVLCMVLSRYEQRLSVVDLGGSRIFESDLGTLSDTSLDWIGERIARLGARPELGFQRISGISLIASPDVEFPGPWTAGKLNDFAVGLSGRLGAAVASRGLAEALHIAEIRNLRETPPAPTVLVHAGFALEASMVPAGGNSPTEVIGGDLNDAPVSSFEDTGRRWVRLEEIASAGAILRRLGHVKQHGPVGETGLGLGVPHAIRQANSGDPRAVAAFRDAGEALGGAIAALVMMLRPARVLLAGPLASAAPFLNGFRDLLGRDGGAVIARSTLSDLQAAEAIGLEHFAFAAIPEEAESP